MYNRNKGCPIGTDFNLMKSNRKEKNIGISLFSNKGVDYPMSMVKIIYKQDFIVVAADRKITVYDPNNEFTRATFTYHSKVKYIEKYQCVISAVGDLFIGKIWWDEYIQPFIEKNESAETFLNEINKKLIKDNCNIELHLILYNEGAPKMYIRSFQRKEIIDCSVDDSGVYIDNRTYTFGEEALGSAIDEFMPIHFTDNNYLLNYAEAYLRSAIKIQSIMIRHLSKFQTVPCATLDYPIDVISIANGNVRYEDIPF
ncbi:MAG: hypothetical protein IJ571_00205 [Ruminococcus sp.]|nr:hypothetical protein [Ruminococcus sp.]